MKLSQNFPFALPSFQTVPHQKQPYWKLVSTEQNQTLCESCIIICPLQQNYHDLWILLILIPECDLLAQDTECPHGSYWDEPKQLQGIREALTS